MYHLAWFRDSIIQKVVSEEMAAGFLLALDLDDSDKNPMEYIKPAILRDMFNSYSDNVGLHDLSDDIISIIILKIKKMYTELIDPVNEYIFDEFGKYIVSMFIHQAVYIDLIGAGTDFTDIDFKDYTFYSLSKHSPGDLEHIKKFCEKFYDDNMASLPDIDRDKYIFETLSLLTVFFHFGGHLCGEYTGDISPIYWDDDHMLFDSISTSGIFLNRELSKARGFIMGSDDYHEPLSGSVKVI